MSPTKNHESPLMTDKNIHLCSELHNCPAEGSNCSPIPGMACLTYNSVFARSGPPTVANMNISRSSQQVAASMGVLCIATSLLYLADFFYVLCQRSKYLEQY